MPAHRVFLVRHAKAEAQAADDDARRLTAEGRARFARLLARLRDRLRVVRVLTSPLARARETADMLAQVTGAPVERDPRLAAGRSSARDVVAMVRKAPPGTALVGHNPELAQALSRISELELDVKPGAVAALDVDGDEVVLAWLEVPGKA